jgi:multiple sugar transport system permease protein
MSSTQTLGTGSVRAVHGLSQPRREWRLHGSDTAWAVAFLLPYAGVFVAFVIYPVVFGLWMGSDPALYRTLFSDPLYLTTAFNTLLFAAVGVTVQIFGAFLLSGFFMQRGRFRRILLAVYLLPCALPALSAFVSIHYMTVSELGFADSVWRTITGEDGPLFLVSRWLATSVNIASYVWKWMPFWTLVFMAARMAIPAEVYEAAAIDGASRLDCLVFVTFPLLANVYLVCTLLAAIWAIGDFSTVYFVSYGAPARETDILATFGFHRTFDFGYPNQGVAAMMSALPVLIPAVILLMRRIRLTGVQL